MKKLILMLIGVLAIAGCEEPYEPIIEWDTPPNFETFTRSYVMGYYIPEKLEISAGKAKFIDGVHHTIGATFWRSERAGTFMDVGEKKDVYDALCKKNNDMSFNKTVHIDGQYEVLPNGDLFPVGITEYSAYNIVSINVVSDADFDDKHPAGTSLANILMFSARTSKPFIDSGYNYSVDWGDDYPSKPDFENGRNWNWIRESEIEKNLADVTPEDLVLMGYYTVVSNRGDVVNTRADLCGFRFDALPTLEKTHNITVTLTDERGEVFSDTVKMVFE
jgi:hypothetical protein